MKSAGRRRPTVERRTVGHAPLVRQPVSQPLALVDCKLHAKRSLPPAVVTQAGPTFSGVATAPVHCFFRSRHVSARDYTPLTLQSLYATAVFLDQHEMRGPFGKSRRRPSSTRCAWVRCAAEAHRIALQASIDTGLHLRAFVLHRFLHVASVEIIS